MVLQWGKPVKIWGTDEPGTRISVRIAAVYSEAVTGEDGKWSVTLPVMRKSRNSLSMSVENDRGESIKINDVLVGDVWFMSGQSNMDLLMSRAGDRYPDEFSACENNLVRVFRITENGVFGRMVTARNGNSIFLPAAGYQGDSSLFGSGTYGSYWSSSLYSDDSGTACSVYFGPDSFFRNTYLGRYYGFSVRPVSD